MTVARLVLIAALALATGCAAAPPLEVASPVPAPAPELARFMRELVNVPFSFAVLERDGARRPARFRGAARVLQGAIADLAHWQAPPRTSAQGRAVFLEYARHLQRQVARFELATRRHDAGDAAARLDEIGRTCNGCHRFFRPAGALSTDVVGSRVALDDGRQR